LRRISAAVDVGSALVRGRHIRDGEPNASSPKRTAPETFVTLSLRSQMPRWENVPFLLRAAKGVGQSRRHIELRFAHRLTRPSIGFVRLEVLAGNLVIGLVEGDATSVEFALSSDAESASTRLLRAALGGDETFTLHPQEPEESWRIVEPLLEALEKSEAAMLTYPVGASTASILGS